MKFKVYSDEGVKAIVDSIKEHLSSGIYPDLDFCSSGHRAKCKDGTTHLGSPTCLKACEEYYITVEKAIKRRR